MALSCHWPTKIITIPKTDLNFVSMGRYNLTVEKWFQLLRELQGTVEGMAETVTGALYSNTPPTSSTPRIVEVINGWKVQFENDQYSMEFIDGNTNIRDVEIKNLVSVGTNNTTGFINPIFLEHGTFNGAVHWDSTSPLELEPGQNQAKDGDGNQYGTPAAPLRKLADVMTVAMYRGFNTINVIGDGVIDSGGDYSNMIFVGESHEKSCLTVSEESNVDRCEFYSAKVEGTLDAKALLRDCMIEDLNYVNGEIKECLLKPPGVMVLGGFEQAVLVRCVTECTGEGEPYTIAMGAGQPMAIRDFHGKIRLRNKNGTENSSAVMSGGTIVLDMATMTDGVLSVAGVCDILDTVGNRVEPGMYGDFELISRALNNDSIASAVMSSQVESSVSMEAALKIIVAALAGKLSGANEANIKIRNIADTKDVIDVIVDEHGNRLSVTLDVS